MPEWVDSGDKIASIVGGASGLLSLVVAVLAYRAQTAKPPRKRRYLVVCAAVSGLLAVPSQLNNITPAVYALTGLAVLLLLVHFVLTMRSEVPFDQKIRRLLVAQKQHAMGIKYRFGTLHAPTINSIYVEQRGHSSTEDAQVAKVVPLTTLLSADHSCLLEGGPGSGKSTFVTRAVASSSEHWTETRRFRSRVKAPESPHVALYLPATMLVGQSVTSALAAFARELGAPVPEELLERPPWRGVSWLVFIDGLDEIQDTHERSRILHVLGEAVRTGPHRLIITTRPLSPSETNELSSARYFRLRSFTPDDLATFAGNWARTRSQFGSSDAFLEKLRRSGLASLAQVPLIATMAALLYEDDPLRTLPANRTKLYEEFVVLLRSGRVTETREATADQLFPWLTEHLDELLAVLAHHTVFSSGVSLFEHASAYVRTHHPQLTESSWRGVLRSTLTTSGLLLQRGADVEFLHQSIAEYIAAAPKVNTFDFERWRELMNDASTRSFALFSVGHQPQLANQIAGQLLESDDTLDVIAAGRLLADGASVEPGIFHRVVKAILRVYAEDEDYLLDCLDILVALLHGPDVLRRLQAFCTDDAQGAWQRALLADALLAHARAEAIALLRRIVVSRSIRDPWTRKWVLQRLVAEGDLFGELLARAKTTFAGRAPLASDDKAGIDAARRLLADLRLSTEDRTDIAIMLLDADDTSGLALVHDCARTGNRGARLDAAKALHRNHCPGGFEALLVLAHDRRAGPSARFESIVQLAAGHREHAASALAKLLVDTRNKAPSPTSPRKAIMIQLQDQLDHAAAQESAHHVALRKRESINDRIACAEILQTSGSTLAVEALTSIVRDQELPPLQRYLAVRAAQISGLTGTADFYFELSLDPAMPVWLKMNIATELRHRRDPRYVTVLMELVRQGDRRSTIYRTFSCRELIKAGESSGWKQLLNMAADPSGASDRELAISTLVAEIEELPDVAVTRLLDLLFEGGIEINSRMEVALRIAKDGHARADNFIFEFVTSPSLTPATLTSAIRRLCAARSAEDLLSVLDRLSVDPPKQRQVARLIAWEFESVEALVASRALVIDEGAPAVLRRSVAAVLSWAHDPYGVAHLRSLKGDPFAARTLVDVKLDEPGEISGYRIGELVEQDESVEPGESHQERNIEPEAAVLKLVALDPSAPAAERLKAADALLSRDDTEVVHAYDLIADDKAVEPESRQIATLRMIRLHRPRAIERAVRLLHSDELSQDDRHELGEALVHEAGLTGATAYLEAAEPGEALELLSVLKEEFQGAAVLAHALSIDTRFEPEVRLEAVEYAASNGRPEALESIDKIAEAMREESLSRARGPRRRLSSLFRI
ncbi:hypothetical protein Lesp02_44610 [Lentzea sp. NBRC 105346]|uniref:NACHT domain-containing protein n=1 Tax=Lentzea sp. NBRC 105346 TaxID=3032205 RepID=UPI0024A12053|nr:NACHT domain-containing protein [Lentzea sp. NBRC 105346]GLZ32273.1 hypothetical protein Lesp02_44610 [Lentzea sp. NBRC 105346]